LSTDTAATAIEDLK